MVRTDDKTPSPFLNLPPELRLQIYDHLFDEKLYRYVKFFPGRRNQVQGTGYRTAKGNQATEVSALLKTCKLLYTEVKSRADAATELWITISYLDKIPFPWQNGIETYIGLKKDFAFLKALDEVRLELTLGMDTKSDASAHVKTVLRRIKMLASAIGNGRMLKISEIKSNCHHHPRRPCTCLESYDSKAIIETLLDMDYRAGHTRWDWQRFRRVEAKKVAFSNEAYSMLLDKRAVIEGKFGWLKHM